MLLRHRAFVVSRGQSNAVRKEEVEDMATSVQHRASEVHSAEIVSAATGVPVPRVEALAESKAVIAMRRILEYIRDQRALGPLSIVVFLVIYSLLSRHLPAGVYQYISRINH